MKRNVCAVAVFATAMLSAPVQAADFFLTVGPETSSTDFGNTASTAGTLFDRYFFTVPAGSANGLIGSIALTSQLDVDFTSVTLDDVEFDVILADGTELRTLSPTLLGAGQHVITVQGSWGEDGGSYAGTLNYSPGIVPEPASWALMITGIGLVGGAMRRRSKTRTRVSFA